MSTTPELTPHCRLCGHPIELLDDGFAAFRGQWMHLGMAGIDTPVFVLHPDTKLHVLQLANGQLALLPDQSGHPSMHAHVECMSQLAMERFDNEVDPESFDDEEYEHYRNR